MTTLDSPRNARSPYLGAANCGENGTPRQQRRFVEHAVTCEGEPKKSRVLCAPINGGKEMIHRIILIFVLLMVAGCGQIRPLAPAGCSLTAYRMSPTPLDPQLSAGAGSATMSLDQAIATRIQQATRAPIQVGRKQVLVLSGGGEHGAFGAGLFLGLPTVPTYNVVTGVSTGSLQSTFLFLANQPEPNDRQYPPHMARGTSLGSPGKSNLGDLAAAYAITKESDLMNVRTLKGTGAVLHGTIATFDPLRKTILGLISPQTIREVASEGEDKGRSLLVGVTDLDDGYGYAIDLTALAIRAKHDGSVEAARHCYVEALIASSSVPPGVPPVTLRTDNDGVRTDLYMDGGARFGVFFNQLGIAANMLHDADMTLVVNGSLYGDPWRKNGKAVTGWSVLNYPLRAVDVMENQVYRLSVADAELWGTQNGTLKMAFISNENLHSMTGAPDAWTYAGKTCAKATEDDDKRSPLEFHATYMRCLLDYGWNRGQRDPWNKVHRTP